MKIIVGFYPNVSSYSAEWRCLPLAETSHFQLTTQLVALSIFNISLKSDVMLFVAAQRQTSIRVLFY